MADRGSLAGGCALRIAAWTLAAFALSCAARAAEEPPHSAELDAAIIRQAKRNGVPEKLIRRIVMRESRYNATARNRSYWGLMQISYPTARSMGFKGTPEQLLNPFVNLTYAVPYLANAFIIAGKQEDAAVRLYASGYYATAKNRGLLGLLRTAESAPASGAPGEPDVPSVTTVAALPQPEPAPSYGVFGALLAPSEQPRSAEQLVASAPEAAAAEQPGTVALPASAKGSDDVALTIGKAGAMQPPKKWLHDGGVSTITRGEQSVDQVASHASADAGETARPKHGHARKVTTFAAFDPTPSTAQAYAGPTDAQEPRYAQSQAAIAQVTSGPQTVAAEPAPTAVGEPKADDRPAKKRRVAHKPTEETTAVAKADTADDGGDVSKTKAHHAKRSSLKKDAASSLQADGTTTIEPPQIRPTVQ